MRRRVICYTIGDREDGIVLGQFLKTKGFSHRLVVRIKAGQGLAVDGMPVYAGYRLKAGETVEVALPEEEDSGNIVPVKLPLAIVYEDEDILVINKDAGVPIHPSQATMTIPWPTLSPGTFMKRGKHLLTGSSTVWTGIPPGCWSCPGICSAPAYYRNKWPGAESGGSTGPLYLGIHRRKVRLTAPLPGQKDPPSSAGWTLRQAKGQSPITIPCSTTKKRTCLW